MNYINLIEKLVNISSYVDKNQNEFEMAIYLFNFIKRNLPWLSVKKQFISKNRFNIIALPNSNPQIIFFSHMDTVKPQDNLKAIIRGTKLFGLGALDMKSGLALSLWALKEIGPKSNVGIILDCDEEYYFEGLKKLVSLINLNPKYVIFPEPSDGNIVYGCRGILELDGVIEGKSSHASKTQLGINAIEKTLELTNDLKEYIEAPPKDNNMNLAFLEGGIARGNNIVR